MILVVGTGRCGSSAVAATLERMGWDFGGKGTVRPETPDGDYEDRVFKELNWRFAKREIAQDEYIRLLRDHIAGKKEPWGLKHPLIAEFPMVVAEALPDDMIVVWVQRDLADTIESWKRTFPGPDDFCQIWVPFRHFTLAAWLWKKPHIRIDMTNRVSEAALEKALADAMDQLVEIKSIDHLTPA